MKKLLMLLVVLCLAPAVRADDVQALAQDLKARRARVVKALGADGVMVLRSRKPAHFSNDIHYPFREDNNLYYLTGLDEPGTVLVVSGRPIENYGHTVVFTRTSRAGGYSFGNPRPTRAEVAARTGLPEAAVLSARELDRIVKKTLGVRGKGAKVTARRVLHYDHLAARRAGVAENDPVQSLALALRKGRSSRKKVQPPRRILNPLRAVKSDYEIACMKQAIEATEAGLRAAIREIRSGMHEYEIAAVIEYHYRRRGCEGMAFPSIVGSGPNSCIPHYTRNRRQAKAGELVVLDVGGDYRHYAADITRTVPVSGTFSPRQREIYALVLQAQQAAIEAVKPGARFNETDRVAREIIGKGLKKLGLIKNTQEARRYFMHGTSHTLGMDVHDVWVNTLEPGMVITVEPGIYIPEEALGIRIEDDVRVTRTGSEVLSRGVPKRAEEIEALMAGEKGPRGQGAEGSRDRDRPR